MRGVYGRPGNVVPRNSRNNAFWWSELADSPAPRFMQLNIENDEGHLLEPVLSGTVALPAGEVREPFVDADDIADVAVAALTDQRHAGQLYELIGPRLLTLSAAVGEISKAAGRDIRYTTVSSEQYRAALTEHAGPEFANMLTDLMAEVLDGRNAWLGDGVQKALGRKPRDFADYARQTAATGIWEGQR